MIVRTDYSNDEAFSQFLETITQSEAEGIESLFQDEPAEPEATDANPGEQGEESEEEEEEEEGQDAAEAGPQPTGLPDLESFIVIDPSAPSSPHHQLRQDLTNAANIIILRLFNDVDILPCPPLPQGQKKGAKGPGSRIIDSYGLHEVYDGRLIWVYDSTSNTDKCVRLISHRPTSYGTATYVHIPSSLLPAPNQIFFRGDSWRARGSSIWELQVNLDAGTMKIDFGGEDRYTLGERQRNMEILAQSGH